MTRKPLPPRNRIDINNLLRRGRLEEALRAYLNLPLATRAALHPELPALLRGSIARLAATFDYAALARIAALVSEHREPVEDGRDPEQRAVVAWPLVWAAGLAKDFKSARALLPLVMAHLAERHPGLGADLSAWIASEGAAVRPNAPALPWVSNGDDEPVGRGHRPPVARPATPDEARQAVAALYASCGWAAVVDVLGYQWLVSGSAEVSKALREEAVRWGIHAALDPSLKGTLHATLSIWYAGQCAALLEDKAALRDSVSLLLRLAIAKQGGASPLVATLDLMSALHAAVSDPELRTLGLDTISSLGPGSERDPRTAHIFESIWKLTLEPRVWLLGAGYDSGVVNPSGAGVVPGWITEGAATIARDQKFWRAESRKPLSERGAIVLFLDVADDAAIDLLIEHCWEELDGVSKRKVAEAVADDLSESDDDYDDDGVVNPFSFLFEGDDDEPRSEEQRRRIARLSPRLLVHHERYLLLELSERDRPAGWREVLQRFYAQGGSRRVAGSAMVIAADDGPHGPALTILTDFLSRFDRDIPVMTDTFELFVSAGAPVPMLGPLARALVGAIDASPGPLDPAAISLANQIRKLFPPRAAKPPKTAKPPKAAKAPKTAKPPKAAKAPKP